MSGQTKADYKAKCDQLQTMLDKALASINDQEGAIHKLESDLQARDRDIDGLRNALEIAEIKLETTQDKLKMIGDWIREASE